MARLNRNELKKIIKECLFEILTEASSPDESRSARPKPKARKIVERSNSRGATKEFLSNVKKQKSPVDVSQITSDPVMAAIFEDTARTTLIEQTNGEKRVPSVGGSPAGMPGVEHVPSDLSSTFGESADKWADLAFASKISKK